MVQSGEHGQTNRQTDGRMDGHYQVHYLPAPRSIKIIVLHPPSMSPPLGSSIINFLVLLDRNTLGPNAPNDGPEYDLLLLSLLHAPGGKSRSNSGAWSSLAAVWNRMAWSGSYGLGSLVMHVVSSMSAAVMIRALHEESQDLNQEHHIPSQENITITFLVVLVSSYHSHKMHVIRKLICPLRHTCSPIKIWPIFASWGYLIVMMQK